MFLKFLSKFVLILPVVSFYFCIEACLIPVLCVPCLEPLLRLGCRKVVIKCRVEYKQCQVLQQKCTETRLHINCYSSTTGWSIVCPASLISENENCKYYSMDIIISFINLPHSVNWSFPSCPQKYLRMLAGDLGS